MIRAALQRAKRAVFRESQTSPTDNGEVILGNTVIVRVAGGLANQMLCYKLGRYLSYMKGSSLILDASPYISLEYASERTFQLQYYDAIYDALVFSQPSMERIRASNEICFIRKEMLHPATEETRAEILTLALSHRVVYCDLWLALYMWKEIDRHAEDHGVLDELTLKPESCFVDHDYKVLALIRKAPDPVAIHVRRGDFATHDGNLLVAPEYYNRSMADLAARLERPHFFVFSDEIDWCKQHLTSVAPITFVDFHTDRDGYKDMFLASQCRHFILSNESTFSHQILQLSEKHAGRTVLHSGEGDLSRNHSVASA